MKYNIKYINILSDTSKSEWCFVKKYLTEEKGWVPVHLLMDEITYTTFVQTTLHEKIDKLPVFESKFT